MTFHPEPGLQTFAELGVRVVGVPDREDPAVGVRGDRLDRGPQLVGDAARLVEDDQHVAAVDALEAVLVGVGRLAAVPTRVPSSSFHSSDCRTRPGRPPAVPGLRISSHRIAWTCW
jgi:hypothetical protein